jgi:glutamyl-tRNA synthetase
MGKVRVRFAPSPTGFLHMGVARTALYNWLYARHEGGTFVLRIEDTDKTRSTKEFLDALIADLRWLGLDWDEGPGIGGPVGPYFQSERASTYGPYVERLLREGAAYHCFCTAEELEERRRAAPEDGVERKYDRRCLALPEAVRNAYLAEGRPAAVRFRIPEGKTGFPDLILGDIEVENSQFDDLIIARSDGVPTYNFVAVVDDMLMDITHVIRGSDHITNTPKQILIFRALGARPPEYAHLPLVLDSDKKILSKRRGAVAIHEYRKRGYVAEAVVNYMSLLGWAYDDSREFFTRDELVRAFEIRGVGKKAAAFDPDKFVWMNAQWIKTLPIGERTERVLPYLRDAGLVEGELSPEERKYLERVVSTVGDRVKTLGDIVEQAGFFLASDVTYDSIVVEKVLRAPRAADTLAAVRELFAAAPDFEPATLEQIVRGYADGKGLKLGEAIQPIRVAVTGRTASPGIFEVLAVLGRERTLHRIAKAQERCV